jgi:transposase InsO family protein
VVGTSKKRRIIGFLAEAGRCSVSFGCSALSLARSSYYYVPRQSLFEIELFSNLLDSRVVIEEWRKGYNKVRSHSSLGYRRPLSLLSTWSFQSFHSFRLQVLNVQKK